MWRIVGGLEVLHLYNMCWACQKIPEKWKIVKAIALFNKEGCNGTVHYKGISLLNTVYKIYSKLLNEWLQIITDSILLEAQAGFRKERSSMDFFLKADHQKVGKLILRRIWLSLILRRPLSVFVAETGMGNYGKEGVPKTFNKTYKGLYKNIQIIINSGKTLTTEVFIKQGVRQKAVSVVCPQTFLIFCR